MEADVLIREIDERRAGESASFSGFLPVGSLALNVAASRQKYVDTLDLLLRQKISSRPVRPGAQVAADLRILSCEAEDPLFTLHASVDDGATARWEDAAPGWETLGTGRFRVYLARDRTPAPILVLVREPQWSERAFRDHLFEILCKILFAFDAFYLHAGGIHWHGRTHLFVGQGSFGKSTTCLRLARAGATILSEDHVLLRRRNGRFDVSGCQETARVTEKTERFLFPERLDRPARAHTGVLKKEFDVAEFFSCRPYVDFGIDSIFFNHVGERFEARPISRQDAMLRLLYMTRSFFRYSGTADLEAYLDFFAQLVERPDCFDLELSPDLADLDGLVHRLDG